MFCQNTTEFVEFFDKSRGLTYNMNHIPKMRSIKRIIYGIFYLTVMAGVAYLLYLAFRSPAGCTNGRQDRGEEGLDCGGVCANICLPPDFEKIGLSGSVDIFRAVQDQAVLVAKIKNSNPGIAARLFKYNFEVKNGQGDVIGSVPGESFIYAGELKYLVGFFRSKAADQVVGADLVSGETDWVKETDFPRPVADLLERRTTSIETGGEAVGKIVNRDTVNFAKVEIVAVFKDSRGLPVGASRTELQDMEPDQTREFRVFHPTVVDIDPLRTEYSFSALRIVAR